MKTLRPLRAAMPLFVLIWGLLLGGCAEYESFRNDPPEIQTFTVPKTVRYGETVELKVSVSDPENDDLTYSWDISGGTLRGEGAAVEWTAPHLGAADIAPDTTILVHVAVRDQGEDIVSTSAILTVYSKPYRVAEALSGRYQRLRIIVGDAASEALGSMRLTPTTFTRDYPETDTFFYGAYQLIEPFDDRQGTIYWFSETRTEPRVSTYTWDGELFVLFWTATTTGEVYQKLN